MPIFEEGVVSILRMIGTECRAGPGRVLHLRDDAGRTLKVMQLGLPESARESASSVLVRVDIVERRGLDVLSSKFNVGLRGMRMNE